MSGCASDKQAMQASNTPPPPSQVTCAALAFDPPITLAEGPVNISRDNRGPAALAGFEEPSTSTYGIYSENRQADDGSDFVVRDAFSFRTGQVSR